VASSSNFVSSALSSADHSSDRPSLGPDFLTVHYRNGLDGLLGLH